MKKKARIEFEKAAAMFLPIWDCPKAEYLSLDHDPLFRFHQWQANLRILEVTEINPMFPYLIPSWSER